MSDGKAFTLSRDHGYKEAGRAHAPRKSRTNYHVSQVDVRTLNERQLIHPRDVSRWRAIAALDPDELSRERIGLAEPNSVGYGRVRVNAVATEGDACIAAHDILRFFTPHRHEGIEQKFYEMFAIPTLEAWRQLLQSAVLGEVEAVRTTCRVTGRSSSRASRTTHSLGAGSCTRAFNPDRSRSGGGGAL